ncbi:MAG: beta-propeller fold lactonase family protein [Gemmataceae bacterium]|nr:beta-propeller fold lactonase family protein [Gemmataceae bacterium]
MRRISFISGVFLALISAARLYANVNNSLMDVSPNGQRLLVANADNASVTLIDLAAGKAVKEIAVGDKPEAVSWINGGPLAIVTLYAERAVCIVDVGEGKVVARISTKAEPYGVVTNPAGTRAWVTHEYPGIVSEIDLTIRKVIREIPAGSYLRGIALAPDEKRVYVSEFHTGVLNAVDLASGKVVDSWKGHSTDNLARHVLLHPRRPKAYLTHIRSMVKVNDGRGSIFPHLSFCDLNPGEGKRRVSFGMDTFNGVYVTTNPWEADISPDGKRLYVIYAGTNDMNVCNVIDDDYKEITRAFSPVQLGRNPRAVRVSPDGQTVYVLNALDFAVSVYKASTMSKVATIKTCEPPKTPEWVQGKILFNAALPPMTSPRWVACFSCHPDGGHDGRVWQQPEGLRKATAFFGMAHTHPLHYSADRDEVQDFEFTIRSALMRGDGLIRGNIKAKVGYHKAELEEKTSNRSKDLDALAIYCNSFEPLLSPHVEAPGKLSEAAVRGKEFFFRKDVACATCHSGPYYTDSTLTKPYKLHDVGTGEGDASEKMGSLYDTPTLVALYRSAPYLHRGQAKTLHEVLTKFNPNDKHGKTSHLKEAEIDDLVQFMLSLPYEALPEKTPNTVEFRVAPRK